MFRRAKSGFTVLEAVVVLIVLGLLSILAFVKYGETREKAYRDAMMNDLRNFALAEEQFFHNSDRYGTPEEIAASGWYFSRDLQTEFETDSADGYFFQVGHARTKTRCDIDYGTRRPGQRRHAVRRLGLEGDRHDGPPLARYAALRLSAGLSVRGGSIPTSRSRSGSAAASPSCSPCSRSTW